MGKTVPMMTWVLLPYVVAFVLVDVVFFLDPSAVRFLLEVFEWCARG